MNYAHAERLVKHLRERSVFIKEKAEYFQDSEYDPDSRYAQLEIALPIHRSHVLPWRTFVPYAEENKYMLTKKRVSMWDKEKRKLFVKSMDFRTYNGFNGTGPDEDEALWILDEWKSEDYKRLYQESTYMWKRLEIMADYLEWFIYEQHRKVTNERVMNAYYKFQELLNSYTIKNPLPEGFKWVVVNDTLDLIES